MVAPGAVISDVHAVLALPLGADQGTVHVNARQFEERRRLPGPGPLADLIEDIDQVVHIVGLKAPTEIAGRGWIRNASRAQSIEKDLVLAAQFQVLQAGAVTQGVVSQVEHVIRLVVRQMDLQQVQAFIDGIDQTDAPCQHVKSTNASMGYATRPLGHFIVDGAGRQHGLGATTVVVLVQPALETTLAIGQLSSYARIHSKSLLASGPKFVHYSSDDRKRLGFRVFS
jgi:hypothetical protein